MTNQKNTIAISIGDVYGIGPEIVLKAFDRSELFDVCRPVLYGPLQAVEYYITKFGFAADWAEVQGAIDAADGILSVVDCGGEFDESLIGHVTAEGGRLSIKAVKTAFEAVISGSAEALVTAPISKEAIGLAGSEFRGHTDMLASFCDCRDDVIMILSSNTMKVGLVTIHVPVSEVAGLVTTERVHKTIRLGHRAMTEDFGREHPRIAVLALNPHAGDGGFLGTEEEQSIRPAIELAAEEGISVDGPFAADGFFSTHNKQIYDLIIAQYHDQGLIPFKMQDRGRGVNVSFGLPIVRTSPDHGTAYNIASFGIANAESMKEAIASARAIALNRMTSES